MPEVTVEADVSRELGEGYNPPNAVSATKTDAPLRDIPQTFNVVTAEAEAEAEVGRVFADGAAASRITGAVQKANNCRSRQFLDRSGIAPSLELRIAPETKANTASDKAPKQEEQLWQLRCLPLTFPARQRCSIES